MVYKQKRDFDFVIAVDEIAQFCNIEINFCMLEIKFWRHLFVVGYCAVKCFLVQVLVLASVQLLVQVPVTCKEVSDDLPAGKNSTCTTYR